MLKDSFIQIMNQNQIRGKLNIINYIQNWKKKLLLLIICRVKAENFYTLENSLRKLSRPPLTDLLATRMDWFQEDQLGNTCQK